jgi:hypothetical protein
MVILAVERFSHLQVADMQRQAHDRAFFRGYPLVELGAAGSRTSWGNIPSLGGAQQKDKNGEGDILHCHGDS